MQTNKKHLFMFLAGLAFAGCATDFDPYEDIKTPRLLAIAADLPLAPPDATITLSALVTDVASYQWSWCPLIGAGAEGYPCLVSHADFQAVVDEVVGAGIVVVPDYDLGTGPTAALVHSVPPALWSGLCDVLQSGQLGPIAFPACNESFEVNVKLVVNFGDTVLTGVRDVRLLYDAGADTNAVPSIGGVSAIHPDTNDTVDLDGLDPELERDVEYQLELALDESESESYEKAPVEGGPSETVRESLRVSWFHEGGEIDKIATSFIDGSSPIDNARTNLWRTPTTEERAADTSRLFIVIRDDRGGTSWIERTVRLAQ